MTAVASPPSLQSLPRLGWNSSGNGAQTGISAEDVSRICVPKKGPQRQNSSSSLSSASSASSKSSESTVASVDSKSRKEPPAGGEEKEGWRAAKLSRGFWSQPKPEVNSVTTPTTVVTGRLLANGTSAFNGPVAPTTSTLSQTAPLVPSQKMVQPPPQANGVRVPMPPAGQDPPALLVLLPMNGTFERKQINVPQFPEILRIGRQTNAKTVPTPTNGFFDSKVLSRQHAEVWADRSGKIWIRDVKSSNGTFVNGMRLSPESRDSEPHELRENDVLELGIDIVSEDQKSIVHHKVSAKVEHAGIPTNATSVLDLNLGDIEPGSGGGLSMLPPNLQMRGRLGSQGSIGSNGRGAPYGMGAANLNGVGVQRHMGAWLSPVTIEQVVKRLTVELRQAKQQAHELNRAGDYVNALLHSEPGEELPKVPPDILPPAPIVNGTSPQKGGHVSPFSQPPAPPPQLPLPEKPDSARAMPHDHDLAQLLKTDKTQMNGLSPTKLESPSSQILSLTNALMNSRVETDSQRNRVKQLEEQLKQERRARESAEERARHLLDRSKIMHSPFSSVQDDTASISSDDTQITTIECPDDTDENTSDTITDITDVHRATGNVDSSMSKLQERLNSMSRNMEEMKNQLEHHKRRADTAEQERESLADMVERIRQGDAKAKPREASLRKKRSSEMATQTDSTSTANGSVEPGDRSKHQDKNRVPEEANGTVDRPKAQAKQLQNAVAALALHRDDRLAHSAPYASILGVVLIGVGLMTYLNGWQKIER